MATGVPIVPPPRGAPEAPDTQAGSRTSHSPGLVTWIGVGLAGAGVIAGSVTGLMAIPKTSGLTGECANHVCGPTAHSDLDSANTLATVSNVAFAVAGVGAAVAVVSVVVGHEAPAEPTGEPATATVPTADLWFSAAPRDFAARSEPGRTCRAVHRPRVDAIASRLAPCALGTLPPCGRPRTWSSTGSTPAIRAISRRHWTPVAVASRAAQLFRHAGARRVLDVGRGSGSSSSSRRASTPELTFVGIEQRVRLVEVARTAQAAAAHAERVVRVRRGRRDPVARASTASTSSTPSSRTCSPKATASTTR